MIKEFIELLDKMKAIHTLKNEDYAKGDAFENFTRAAEVSSWFEDPMDKVFATLITVKLARIATLTSKKTNPNNESIEDSFLDLSVYTTLWASYRRRKSGELSNSTQRNVSTAQSPLMPMISEQPVNLAEDRQSSGKHTDITSSRTLNNICPECNTIIYATQPQILDSKNRLWHSICYNSIR